MPCCVSCAADNNDALWLPQNSVRAIIAILIVFFSFGALTFLVVYLSINAQYSLAIGVSGIMSTALSSVVTTYFANRSAQQANKQITDVQNQHIANLQNHNTNLQNHNLQLLQVVSTNNVSNNDQIDDNNIDHINDHHVIDVNENN
jgi:ABC-type enterochelin transport system permease subunit